MATLASKKYFFLLPSFPNRYFRRKSRKLAKQGPENIPQIVFDDTNAKIFTATAKGSAFRLSYDTTRDLWTLRRMIWGKFASFSEEMEIRENYLKHSETTPSCDGLFAMKSIFWCSSFLGSFFVGICWDLCGCGVSFKLRNFFNVQDQGQHNSN